MTRRVAKTSNVTTGVWVAQGLCACVQCVDLSMDPIAKLFGSSARVKLLRLFLFNDDASFNAEEVAFRAKVGKHAVRKELGHLVTAGVLKKRAGKPVSYTANQRFVQYEPLKAFLRTSTGVSDARITNSFKKSGPLRLVALSGLFTGVIESKVDLLVVSDRIDDRVIANAVHALEAELGRELRYAAFTTPDFRYRVGVYDRLVRDIFDYPHRLILDKIGM